MAHTDFLTSVIRSVHTVGARAHTTRRPATRRRSWRTCDATPTTRSLTALATDSSRPMSATWPSTITR